MKKVAASEGAIQSFKKLLNDKELSFQAFEMFPIPIEIFASDGTAIFINKALQELHGFSDKDKIVGKYNVLKDNVCNDLLGFRKTIKKAFSGEAVFVPNFKPPVQDLVDRGLVKEKPFESAQIDAYLSPIMDKNNLIYVMCVLIIKNIYRGNPDVARAKEYLNLNWRGKFEPQIMAKSMNISVTQLYKLFKEHAGMTPGEYHKLCKIEQLKEKLSDKNLTVKEAFKACGEDSKGWILRVFKNITGFSPAEWREQNSKPNLLTRI